MCRGPRCTQRPGVYPRSGSTLEAESRSYPEPGCTQNSFVHTRLARHSFDCWVPVWPNFSRKPSDDRFLLGSQSDLQPKSAKTATPKLNIWFPEIGLTLRRPKFYLLTFYIAFADSACVTCQTGSVPGAPGARRGLRKAESLQKKRGRIHVLIVVTVRPGTYRRPAVWFIPGPECPKGSAHVQTYIFAKIIGRIPPPCLQARHRVS